MEIFLSTQHVGFGMQKNDNFCDLPDSLRGAAVSIGKFDGVHLGHMLIINRLRSHAARLQAPAVILTFDPPPITLLRPDLNIKPICTLERKIELLEESGPGIDAVIVFETTQEFLQQSAETFFFKTLVEELKIKAIVEGRNFSFGRDRTGSAEAIRSYGQWTNVEVDIVEPLQLGDTVVSSSGIRRLIAEGKIEYVNELMPRSFQLSGQVVDGDHRGRLLGFPTANLDDIRTIVPKPGIYAGLVHFEERLYPSTMNIGPCPTFGIENSRVEVFLHDFNGNLYGQTLRVDVLSRLRDIVRFDSKDDLIRQMRKDVEQSAAICRSRQ